VAQLQAGQAARYEHIKRRRGLSAFAITEQAPDPLQKLAAVYDVVRHDEPLGDAATAGSTAGMMTDTQGPSARQPPQQQLNAAPPAGQNPQGRSAPRQYDEGTLLCNYLPMVREYLQSAGEDASQPQDQPPDQQQTQQQGRGTAGADAMEEGSDGEYVYDLYAAVEEGAEGQAEEEGWWDLHASGAAPVVQVRAERGESRLACWWMACAALEPLQHVPELIDAQKLLCCGELFVLACSLACWLISPLVLLVCLPLVEPGL
jgi:hypothetical protein